MTSYMNFSMIGLLLREALDACSFEHVGLYLVQNSFIRKLIYHKVQTIYVTFI